jgi:hypothetical protein
MIKPTQMAVVAVLLNSVEAAKLRQRNSPDDSTLLELERQHNYYKRYTQDSSYGQVSEDINEAILATD